MFAKFHDFCHSTAGNDDILNICKQKSINLNPFMSILGQNLDLIWVKKIAKNSKF